MKCDILIRGLGGSYNHHLLQYHFHAYFFRAQLNFAAFHLGHIQHVIEQGKKMPG